MNLLLVGLSHRTAPVEVRERYAVAGDAMQSLDEKLAREPSCREALLIATCNRTELLVVTRAQPEARERIYGVLSEIGDGSATAEHFYELYDEEALRHVFRVASSLDSMVLGEAQILGQLKQAYRAAAAAGSCGPLLSRLLQRAFRTAKRVRSETGLGASPVSIARVGVQLASEVFESLEEKRVLLMGAGEMAESALQGLVDAGARDVVVLNRTPETGRRLAARFGARAEPLTALEHELRSADVALASAQVDRPLLGRAELERCMADRAGHPLLMIDLGMPRNLAADGNLVRDVYLYDLDDLDEVAERGRAKRRDAIAPAEAIVQLEVERFRRWLAGLDAVPTIRQLLERAERLAREEALRVVPMLGAGPDREKAAERMARAVVAKLLHHTIERLRNEAAEEGVPYYSVAVRELFGLSEEDE